MTDSGYMIGSHVTATEAPGWQGAMTGRSGYRFAVELADACMGMDIREVRQHGSKESGATAITQERGDDGLVRAQ